MNNKMILVGYHDLRVRIPIFQGDSIEEPNRNYPFVTLDSTLKIFEEQIEVSSNEEVSVGLRYHGMVGQEITPPEERKSDGLMLQDFAADAERRRAATLKRIAEFNKNPKSFELKVSQKVLDKESENE